MESSTLTSSCKSSMQVWFHNNKSSQGQLDSRRIIRICWILLQTYGSIILSELGSSLIFMRFLLLLNLTMYFQSKTKSQVAFNSQKQVRSWIEIAFFSRLRSMEKDKTLAGQWRRLETGLPDFSECQKGKWDRGFWIRRFSYLFWFHNFQVGANPIILWEPYLL